MGPTIADYFRGFALATGRAWNRFWYLPSDAAPLSVLRIVAGLVALYLHVTLSFDLVCLFGPHAILPSDIVRQLELGPAPSYLHFLSTPTELWIAHLLGGGVLVLFTIGLWTRVTSILAVIVTLATIHRGPLLTAEVELVLAFVLVYLCIGPSGAWLSLDAYRSRRHAETVAEHYTATISIRLIQLQTALVYLMMGVVMLSGPNASWWIGDAMWFLIARPESRLIDLTWLAEHPILLNAWSHWVVAYELAFVVFVWNRWTRPLILVLGIPHWLLLAPVSGRPLFCLLMLGLNVVFVPGFLLRAAVGRGEWTAGRGEGQQECVVEDGAH